MKEGIELFKRYRPKKLSAVVGQDGAIRSLQKMIDTDKVPHCILLSGPSGCGKTTIARILKRHLECGDYDFTEINCADFNGINMVRDIRRLVSLAPIDGKVKIWLIDEAHRLTGDAQDAMLKLLEDTPSHAYFFIATTDPQKLKRTIITRASEIKLTLLSQTALADLIGRVCKEEGVKLTEDVTDALVDAAEGSARKALVLLGQVIDLESEKGMLATITISAQAKTQAIELARLLISPNAGWGEVAKILKDLDEEPETIRYMCLGYARSVMLGGGKLAPRAFKMIDCFARNFYDSKQAGLALACYEMVCMK